MGRPNVGKSTLVNTLMGQKIAAVSPRPQTTRRRQLGILTNETMQAVFIDTPGVHKPRHKLGESMNRAAQEALEHCDVILFLVDASHPPHEEDRLLARLLAGVNRPQATIMLSNKCDLVNEDEREAAAAAYRELLPAPTELWISARRGDGLDILMHDIFTRLPQGEPYYPDEQVTDLFEREIAADLLREACLNWLRDEVPHGVAVRVDDYKERGEQGAYMAATIIVERESHKGIVIGKNGQMLKQIGTTARQEIEAMSGRKIYLELRVKVRPNWRDDEKAVRQMVQ